MAEKLKSDIIDQLHSKEISTILAAINALTDEDAQHLAEELCRLAYHYNYRVREAAFLALGKVRSLDLSSVISDGLRDSKIEVFHAAVNLYHRDTYHIDKKAA